MGVSKAKTSQTKTMHPQFFRSRAVLGVWLHLIYFKKAFKNFFRTSSPSPLLYTTTNIHFFGQCEVSRVNLHAPRIILYSPFHNRFTRLCMGWGGPKSCYLLAREIEPETLGGTNIDFFTHTPFSTIPLWITPHLVCIKRPRKWPRITN